MVGLSIFVLAWIRIAARSLSPAPQSSGWTRFPAVVVHLSLYALMIGMPLAGWLILSADAKAIPFFGLGLPPLIGPNEGLADRIEEVHEIAGTIGYYLIALHTMAALAHHYILRDDVLRRMLPRPARLQSNPADHIARVVEQLRIDARVNRVVSAEICVEVVAATKRVGCLVR